MIMIVVEFMFGHYVIELESTTTIPLKIRDEKGYETTDLNDCNALLINFNYKKHYTCNPFPFFKGFIFFGEINFPHIEDISIKVFNEDNMSFDVSKDSKNHIHISVLHILLNTSDSPRPDNFDLYSFLEENNYSIDSLCNTLYNQNAYIDVLPILDNLKEYKVIMDSNSMKFLLDNFQNGYYYLGNIETTKCILNSYAIFFNSDNEYPKGILCFLELPIGQKIKDIKVDFQK